MATKNTETNLASVRKTLFDRVAFINHLFKHLDGVVLLAIEHDSKSHFARIRFAHREYEVRVDRFTAYFVVTSMNGDHFDAYISRLLNAQSRDEDGNTVEQ